MQHVSLRLAASILHDSLHGESRICCLRHHRENGNSNATTKQHDKTNSITSERQETYTLIPPGHRVTFPKQKLKTLMNVTWMQRSVFPRHNHTKAVSLSRTPNQPFCTHCRILVKSKEMASEPRAEMKAAILSTTANLGRSGEWTSSWNDISYSFHHPNSLQPTKSILSGWDIQ